MYAANIDDGLGGSNTANNGQELVYKPNLWMEARKRGGVVPILYHKATLHIDCTNEEQEKTFNLIKEHKEYLPYVAEINGQEPGKLFLKVASNMPEADLQGIENVLKENNITIGEKPMQPYTVHVDYTVDDPRDVIVNPEKVNGSKYLSFSVLPEDLGSIEFHSKYEEFAAPLKKRFSGMNLNAVEKAEAQKEEVPAVPLDLKAADAHLGEAVNTAAEEVINEAPRQASVDDKKRAIATIARLVDVGRTDKPRDTATDGVQVIALPLKKLDDQQREELSEALEAFNIGFSRETNRLGDDYLVIKNKQLYELVVSGVKDAKHLLREYLDFNKFERVALPSEVENKENPWLVINVKEGIWSVRSKTSNNIIEALEILGGKDISTESRFGDEASDYITGFKLTESSLQEIKEKLHLPQHIAHAKGHQSGRRL